MKSISTHKRKGLIAIFAVIILLVIDQIIKIEVKTSMCLHESIRITDWFYISFIENNGMAYGMTIINKLVLSLFRIVAISVLGVYIYRQIKKNVRTFYLACLVLVLAGAIGNLIDCMFYGLIFNASSPYYVSYMVPFGHGYAPFLMGKVVDMFYFPLIVTTWPEWVPFWGGDEFEDILYDYHLADAMVNNDGSDEKKYEMTLYRQAVLKKYGITQAEFDSSLVYYVRHADRLHKIYENLSKRLSDEALALGASANDISKYGDLTSVKDTSNMWRGVSSCVLMPNAPYNTMSFEITADSTYHEGDKLIFSFNSNFIFKEGVRDGVAMLAVQFKNDSIASSVIHLSSNNNYSISIAIDRIRLIRMRNNGRTKPQSTSNNSVTDRDTLKRVNGTNTVKRADSVSKPKQPANQPAIPVRSISNEPVQMKRIAPTPQKLKAQ